MKIGIMTFHRANNFGAVLQAYALQTVLVNNGYEVNIIDYRNDSLERMFHNRSLKVKFKKVVKYFVYHNYITSVDRASRKFDVFRKEFLKLSLPYSKATVKKINELYDVVISGSDQVWNMWYVGGDKAFLLDFVKKEKRYSYAASFGGNFYAEKFKQEILPELQKFETYLVREQAGAKFLKDNLGVDSTVVCDPTLLLKCDDWLKIAGRNCSTENYILCYFVAPETNGLAFAKRMAKRFGCKIKCLAWRGNDPEIEYVNDEGPLGFLSYVKNAKMIVTTSFHGLAFAINLNIPFFFELNHNKDNNNDRIKEMMELFQIQKYEIVDANQDFYEEYNWNLINKTLNEIREKSLNSLVDSLK